MQSHQIVELGQFAKNAEIFRNGKIVPGRWVMISHEELFDLHYDTLIQAGKAGAKLKQINDCLLTYSGKRKLYEKLLVDTRFDNEAGIRQLKTEISNLKTPEDILDLIQRKQKQLEEDLNQLHRYRKPMKVTEESASISFPVKFESAAETQAYEVKWTDMMQTVRAEKNVLETILIQKLLSNKDSKFINKLPIGTYFRLAEECQWDPTIFSTQAKPVINTRLELPNSNRAGIKN